MTSFQDLGIQAETREFTGDKIKIARILNRQIVVKDFKIEKSKYEDKGNGKCLYLQIELDGNLHVVFTGSVNLMTTIQKVPEDAFPFTTTIIETNERYQFT